MDNIKLPEIKKQLSDSKDAILKNITSVKKVLETLYSLNTKAINNKLIFIRRGVDKVNLAQKHISSLKLSFEIENQKSSEIRNAQKEALISISKLEKLLESNRNDLRKIESSSKSVLHFRCDMDALRSAYSCLRTLDTDMYLEEKDLDAREGK